MVSRAQVAGKPHGCRGRMYKSFVKSWCSANSYVGGSGGKKASFALMLSTKRPQGPGMALLAPRSSFRLATRQLSRLGLLPAQRCDLCIQNPSEFGSARLLPGRDPAVSKEGPGEKHLISPDLTEHHEYHH